MHKKIKHHFARTFTNIVCDGIILPPSYMYYLNNCRPQSIQTYKLSKEGGTVKSIKFDELRIVGGLKDRIRILDFQAPNSD